MAEAPVQVVKPRITSIRFSSTPYKRKPKAGDLRETKKHGKQVRVYERHGHMLVRTSNGYRFDWVSYDEAKRRGYSYLIPKDAS